MKMTLRQRITRLALGKNDYDFFLGAKIVASRDAEWLEAGRRTFEDLGNIGSPSKIISVDVIQWPGTIKSFYEVTRQIAKEDSIRSKPPKRKLPKNRLDGV